MAEMKRRRKSRGARPKNAARAHYDQLMKQGMSNSEACRLVGTAVFRVPDGGTATPSCLKSGDIKDYAPISLRRPTVIFAPVPLGVGMDHDRKPVACRPGRLCHCQGARTEPIDGKQGDLPEHPYALW